MDNIRSKKGDDPLPPLQPTALRLYCMRFCPYAQRTRLVLEHKQLPYEVVNIDLGNKPGWFFEKNPEGKVPVLEKGSQIVWESTATSDWLDDAYPSPRLTPSDPYTKARDRMMLEYFSNITSAFYVKLRKPETLEEGIQLLHKHYAFYEKELARRANGPFFGGEQAAMIDLMMWPHFERLPALAEDRDARIAVDVAKTPRLAAWYGAMYELPAVQALLLDNATHNVFLKGWETQEVDYDYGISK